VSRKSRPIALPLICSVLAFYAAVGANLNSPDVESGLAVENNHVGHTGHTHHHGGGGISASPPVTEGGSDMPAEGASGHDNVLVNSDLVATRRTTGQQRALVVVLEADGMPSGSRDEWQSNAAAAAEDLRIASRGLLTIAVDMFPDTVRVTTPTCENNSDVSTEALAVVRQKMSLEAYRFVMFALPSRSSSCSWAGRGAQPGHLTWNWGGARRGTIAHEWGHNLGLGHLNGTRCVRDGSGVQQIVAAERTSSNCAWTEYGGPYSVMGNADATRRTGSALTFIERAQVGWLFDGEESYPDSGAHALYFDGKPALMWVTNAAGEVYALEYVRGKSPEYSWNIYDPISKSWISPQTRSHSGLLVHHLRQIYDDSWYQSSYSRGVLLDTTVLDMNPATVNSLDSALGPGESYSDPAGGLEISVFAVDSAKVDFRLSVSQPLRTPAVSDVTVAREATLGQARVSWKTAKFPSPQTYLVEVSKSPDFSSPSLISAETSLSSTTVTVPGAEFLTTYYVRVTPNSGAGRGPSSPISELRWLPPIPGRVPDFKVSYEARPFVVNASWGKVDAISPVTHYEVRVNRYDSSWTRVHTIGVSGQSSRLSIPNLEFGLEYLIEVRAVNASGVGESGSAFVLKWTKPAVPTAPSSFSATAGTVPGQFAAAWSALSEWQLVDNYEIDVATSPDFAPGTVVSTVGVIGTSAGVVFNAQRDTTYFIRVSGVNMSGKGAASLTRQVRWATPTTTTTTVAPTTTTTTTVAPTTTIAKNAAATVRCLRGAKSRVFPGATCPAKWKKA